MLIGQLHVMASFLQWKSSVFFIVLLFRKCGIPGVDVYVFSNSKMIELMLCCMACAWELHAIK